MPEEPCPDSGPFVCPGCYAACQPCALGCIDAEIERDREEGGREEGRFSGPATGFSGVEDDDTEPDSGPLSYEPDAAGEDIPW